MGKRSATIDVSRRDALVPRRDERTGSLGRIELPKPVLRALRYVPIAVLTAIIVPAVLIPDGERIVIGTGNSMLIAALVAAVVSWRTKSLLLTIVIGMGMLFVWRWLFPA